MTFSLRAYQSVSPTKVEHVSRNKFQLFQEKERRIDNAGMALSCDFVFGQLVKLHGSIHDSR